MTLIFTFVSLVVKKNLKPTKVVDIENNPKNVVVYFPTLYVHSPTPLAIQLLCLYNHLV